MNHSIKAVAISILLCILVCSIDRVLAQNIAGTTSGKVGNATAFPISNYLANPLQISPSAATTTHSRRQNSTGIGGSFVGTESVTSESAPATQPIYAPSIRTPAANNTSGSYSFYNHQQSSPALSGGMSAFSFDDRLGRNSTMSSFGQGASLSNYSSGIDTLPSFNGNSVVKGYSSGIRTFDNNGF